MSRKDTISETQALIELSRAISVGTGLVPLLETIKNLAVRLTGCDRGSLFLLDRTRKELWTMLSDGEGVLRMPQGKGIVGDVVAHNRVVSVADVSSDPRFYSEMDAKTGYETRSVLCAPLRNRDARAMGAIEVINKRAGKFTERDEQMLDILGTQAGLAVEHVEMYEDIRSNVAQLELLLDIQRSINVSMEMEQMFKVILTRLLPAVGAECGIIQTRTAQGEVGFHGYHPEHGLRFWEAHDRRKWPEYLLRLRGFLEGLTSEERDEAYVVRPEFAYAGLRWEGRDAGYVALELSGGGQRLFNPLPVECLKVVAEQTVSLLQKRETLEELRRSDKQALMGSMLSGIVHDLKNPLSGISGFTQLIRRRTDDEKVQRYCNVILEGLERVEKMNRELLHFVRGETVQLEKADFSLRGFFAEMCEGLNAKFAQDGVTVELGPSEDVVVHGDRERLGRVFGNIMSNARESMSGGGKIVVGLTEGHNSVTITISDTGKGMSAHVRERIFQPFMTFGKVDGTGLGMSMARDIVRMHGGDITVDSALGKGTIVAVNIPLARDEGGSDEGTGS